MIHEAIDICRASLAWLQDVHKFCAESDKFSVRMADNIAIMNQNVIALDKELEQLDSQGKLTTTSGFESHNFLSLYQERF
ncbi:hypothetical protein DSO57_1028994 [Entomophthora muscae]|uniref:Uncharacterized protein n=1 Tax=Entomophthora muscae TaxID=34485 RepID=A0ACC2U0E2_9FUNG|nr:hypothetical protein DSO57_1028994 [Entomophthora muscae]